MLEWFVALACALLRVSFRGSRPHGNGVGRGAAEG